MTILDFLAERVLDISLQMVRGDGILMQILVSEPGRVAELPTTQPTTSIHQSFTTRLIRPLVYHLEQHQSALLLVVRSD